jgi:hypothetical protein
MMYRALWLIELLLTVVLVLVLLVPIQDYAMREYKEYLKHPSPETLEAFQDKAGEEPRVRAKVAISIGATMLVLAAPIFLTRRRRAKASSI